MIKLKFSLIHYLTISIAILLLSHPAYSQDNSRWNLTQDGGIRWDIQSGDTHLDHIEMSGFYNSTIVHYGLNKGALQQKLHLVFPMLRTLPNDTHASLAHEINYEDFEKITINGKSVIERPNYFYIKGLLEYQSVCHDSIVITHKVFPSVDQALFIDQIIIHNPTSQTQKITIPNISLVHTTDPLKGLDGSYFIKTESTKHGDYILKPNQSIEYALMFTASKKDEHTHYQSYTYELAKRQKFIEETFSNLIFESPNEILNRSFSFAKIRSVESIYKTKGGLMHGPGGGRYYAAIWANDQAEYANPFFPFLGNISGVESAMNSFRHFARYMNDSFNPIPSSIIAEGTDFWNGAGDRGDMAMIAYGASRFAMASGNKAYGQELWPLIEWCLEFCKRKVNDEGVVNSDSDELEGRFPAGDANLNTSCLYYDALISAALLGKELGEDQNKLRTYEREANAIEVAIEDFFGRTIDGFETYRYYKGNDVLRAWICTPLTVDIFKRTKGTTDALFSETLWTEDGLASASGSTTFWDRATLYALRGVLASGDTKRALPFLEYYSKRRLLGEHVPYPVEAFPEGNQRQLSAESALYCRIITEGLFGIRPVGFQSFVFRPYLPNEWEHMALKNIKAFGHSFDIEINRIEDMMNIKVYDVHHVFINQKFPIGELIKVNLSKTD